MFTLAIDVQCLSVFLCNLAVIDVIDGMNTDSQSIHIDGEKNEAILLLILLGPLFYLEVWSLHEYCCANGKISHYLIRLLIACR